jgi:hypothetical protein
MGWLMLRLAKLGANRQRRPQGRALAERRRDPDAATVQVKDLLGDDEPEASATLSLDLDVRAVDLMEPLGGIGLVLFGNGAHEMW